MQSLAQYKGKFLVVWAKLIFPAALVFLLGYNYKYCSGREALHYVQDSTVYFLQANIEYVKVAGITAVEAKVHFHPQY